MPPRPFPFQLNIGTDIQHVSRIRSLLTKVEPAKRHSQLHRFTKRFLTHLEQRLFWARFPAFKVAGDKTPTIANHNLDPISKHLSGRWAAKEAVIKAFTWRKLSPLNVLILKAYDAGHAPCFALVTDRPCASYWTPEGKESSYAGDTAVDAAEASNTAGFGEAISSDDAAPGAVAEAGRPNSLRIQKVLLRGNFIPSYEQHMGMDGQIAKISISHDGDYTTAVCLAAEEAMQGDVGGEMRAREP